MSNDNPQSAGSLMDDAGIAFDPGSQHLDLSKDEKRRVTALMMAVQAYRDLIIKDAEYLRVASDLARREEGPTIQPATIDAMVIAAMKFDSFISGEMTDEKGDATHGGAQTEAGAAPI